MAYNPERLRELSKMVHETATIKGWHEEERSDRTFLMLVITEVAEAVEADRKGIFGDTDEMAAFVESKKHDPNCPDYESWWHAYYKQYVKPSREAEMADIVIRLLDFAYERYGEQMEWWRTPAARPHGDLRFDENAYYFATEVLGDSRFAISNSIHFVYRWADMLGFDLDWHIEQKMHYNEGRSYHHGGKAY